MLADGALPNKEYLYNFIELFGPFDKEFSNVQLCL